MLVSKIAPVFLLVLAVGAEKKIELQDIEDDNLKSEKESKLEKDEGRQAERPIVFGSGQSIFSLDFLKNSLPKYFASPSAAQQPRYVQQYAVTEQPERAPTAEASVSSPKPLYGPPPTPQQAMVGYLSNVPMQIYLVPQYYNEPTEQAASPQAAVKYSTAPAGHMTGYPTAPEEVQPRNNYIEVPLYIAPSGAAYSQQYSPPAFHYVTYAHPTIAPAQSTVSPILYHMPAVQYPSAIAAPPVVQKDHQYHQYFTETNVLEDSQDEVESPKQYVKQTESPYNYVTQTESPYQKQVPQEMIRYYNSRAPYREEHRHSAISELPPPNPILLKSPPSHLSHLPKALPMYRPLTKPVYSAGGNLLTSAYTPRPSESYASAPFKRRPNSLLDSYIPSGLQVEYLKRGYTKDPLQAYEALSSGRQFSSPAGGPRHYERGFLPNQMYHTGAGGILYGHYKRNPKGEKVPQGPQKK